MWKVAIFSNNKTFLFFTLKPNPLGVLLIMNQIFNFAIKMQKVGFSLCPPALVFGSTVYWQNVLRTVLKVRVNFLLRFDCYLFDYSNVCVSDNENSTHAFGMDLNISKLRLLLESLAISKDQICKMITKLLKKRWLSEFFSQVP